MDGPVTVRVTPVYRDTLTWRREGGDIGVPINGWSRDCQSNSDVQGYSDMGWEDIGVPIDGWSRDCQSNSDVQGYSDMGWGGYRSAN